MFTSRSLRLLFPLFFSFSLWLPAVEASPGEPARTYFTRERFPAAAGAERMAGQGAGVSNGMLLELGGRAPDGTLSARVVGVNLTDGSRTDLGTLSEPVAFAAVTTHQDKVYVAGGLGPDGVTDRVLELSWTQETGLIEKTLPPLPEPVWMAGAGVHRSTVHYFLVVVGGLDASGEATARMVELDLGMASTGWVRLEDLPFGPRVDPMTEETYNELLVLGGYVLESDGVLTPTDSVWGYARIPRDGHQEEGWESRTSLPEPLARAAVSKSGQSHLLLLGGDRAATTLKDRMAGTPPADPVDTVWSYHDPFDVWHPVGQLAEAAAGGVLAPVSKAEFVYLGGRNAGGEHLDGERLQFEISTKKLSWPDWVMLVLYFVVVAMIGWHFSRKQRDAESFALGNRDTNWLAATISLMASGVSTISFMALPALTACIGLANKGPMVFMLLGMVISAHLTYPMLRRLKITSTYEYVEQRFGPALRLVGSFNSIVVQMMGRIGIVVMLPALAISTMVGLDPWISILSMGIITTLYSATGGFEAVVWTDVFQGILLLLGFMAIGFLAVGHTEGGFATTWAYAVELDRNHFFLTKPDVRIANMYFALVGFVLQIMAFASDQVTAQRVLSIPMRHVRKLAYLGGFFGVFIAWLSAFVGLSLFGFFRNQPQYLNPVMENDQLVPIFLVNMVPVGMAGLILATMFAAAMSTVSSSVNVCGVLVAEDFYKKFSKKVTPKKEMRVMQVVTLISGAVGTGMALWLLTMDLPTLWEAFMRIMAYIGGGFGGIFILGMFTRRAHELGAILGVLTSFGMAWFFNTSDLSVHYAALTVLITGSCVGVGYVSSLILPWKRKPLTGLTVWDQIPDQVDDEELERKLAGQTPDL